MAITRNRVKRPVPAFTKAKLAKLGVWLIDIIDHRLQCRDCGTRWWPVLGYGGRLTNDYWACPHGCNADTLPTSDCLGTTRSWADVLGTRLPSSVATKIADNRTSKE